MVKRAAATLVAFATCVTLAQPREPVARIVSTLPSTTEMLFALGLGDRVVGVSDFCRYPPQVMSLPKIGNVLHPDFERILMLRPNLVVTTDRNPELAGRLAAAHVPFVAVATTTLADVSVAMARIGAAAGVEPHARLVISDMEERLRIVRVRALGRRRPRVLLIVGRDPGTLTGIVAAGAGSYLDDLVQLAGGDNVVSRVSSLPYPKVSLESILGLDPQVIIDTIDMSAIDRDRERRNIEGLKLWQRFQTLSAVRAGHVHAAESEALVIPGPRVVDVAEWLAGLIQGAATQ
jgi:iron complex transport system substrate-binding protein